MVLEEVVNSIVIQADGIEQSAGGLNGSGGGVAGPGLRGHGFGDNAAQAGYVEKPGHFSHISEGAGGHENRVIQGEAAQPHAQINIHETRSLVASFRLEE